MGEPTGRNGPVSCACLLYTSILNESFEIEENMYVGIDGEKITYISKEAPKRGFGRVYDGTGKLLMSGFVNTHAHSPMALMRGYGENMALQDWLNKKIFPFEAKLKDGGDIRVAQYE